MCSFADFKQLQTYDLNFRLHVQLQFTDIRTKMSGGLQESVHLLLNTSASFACEYR